MHVEAETEVQDLSLTAHGDLTSNFKTPYQGNHNTYRKHETPSSLCLQTVDHLYHCEVATSVPCWLRANADSIWTHIKLGESAMHSRNSGNRQNNSQRKRK